MIPIGVRTALGRAPLGSLCCRRAELAAMTALHGGLHVTTGEVVLVVEVPTAAAAERLCRLLAGLAPAAQVLLATAPDHHPPPHRPAPRTAHARTANPGDTTPTAAPPATSQWTVIARPATDLARQCGLLTRHGQPLLGLPTPVLHGARCCAAAAWRAALLATPNPTSPTTTSLTTASLTTASLTSTGPEPDPAHSPRLALGCPNPVIGVALLGLARRLGSHAQIRTRHGRDYAELSTDRDIARLLSAVGGGAEAAAAFPPLSRRRPPRTGRAGGDAANTRKARRAADTAATQITAAFAILGNDNPAIPAQLAEAGRLRLAHPELSLTALAQHAQPPLTKHTLHGRIRRLLALAARQHHTTGETDTQRAG